MSGLDKYNYADVTKLREDNRELRAIVDVLINRIVDLEEKVQVIWREGLW